MKADTNHIKAQFFSPLQKTSACFHRYPKLHTEATHWLWIVSSDAQNQPVRAGLDKKIWFGGFKRNTIKSFIIQKASCLTWHCRDSEPLSWVPLHYQMSSSGLHEQMHIWSGKLVCKDLHRLFCLDPLLVTEPAESLSTGRQCKVSGLARETAADVSSQTQSHTLLAQSKPVPSDARVFSTDRLSLHLTA